MNRHYLTLNYNKNMENYSPSRKEPWSYKFVVFLEDIWPSIYRVINDIFFAVVRFIADTISRLWRRY